VDIQEAYHFATIDNGFGNVTDEDDIPDLEAPTECEDEEKVSELKSSCTSEARLSNERHEDHDDDVEPPNSEDDVEVDYEFHNNTAFVQVEFGLEDEDVEETEGLSLIRPTLQALNSPNMWIGDTGATRHSTKYKQGGINSRPSTRRTRGISGQAIKPSMEVDLPGMYCVLTVVHCRRKRQQQHHHQRTNDSTNVITFTSSDNLDLFNVYLQYVVSGGIPRYSEGYPGF
jgi:hypothetical protein